MPARIDDGPASLAMWLRAGRVQRGMSLDDVAKVTKIQPRILERLEAGRLDGLPAEVFVRGFIRSVARCVGLDEREALQRYAACGATALGSAEIIPTVRSLGPSARALVEAMADLAPGSATSARATPRKMLAVEISESSEVDAANGTHGTNGTTASASAGDLVVAMGLAAGSIVRAPSAIGEGRITAPMAAVELPAEAAPVCAVEPEALVAPEAAADAAHADPAELADSEDDASAGDEISAAAIVSPVSPAIAPSTNVTEAPNGSKKKKGKRAKGRNKRRALAAGTPAGASPVVRPAGETWSPVTAFRPPPGTSSVPWRRPAYASAPSAVVPRLVIDDADPDSAEMVLEERAEKQAPRRSFLPPILLDREDRSARQGGLTLAVIILLIAATLTLSYLMRRPSASGDGMTLRGPDVSAPASKQV
jgi:hypothetical protein